MSDPEKVRMEEALHRLLVEKGYNHLELRDKLIQEIKKGRWPAELK